MLRLEVGLAAFGDGSEDRRRLLALLGRHVEMRDDADDARAEGDCQDAPFFRLRDELGRIRAARLQMEDDDVGLHRREIEIDVDRKSVV